jgi:glycosyltransferase involved in cell wall biosynthesis
MSKKVLFIPFGEMNAYHSLLRESVESHDYEVVEGETNIGLSSVAEIVGLIFPLIKYVYSDDIDSVHLVWTHPLFITTGFLNRRISRLVTYARGVILIGNVLTLRLIGINLLWTVHNKYNHEREHRDIDLFISRILSAVCTDITVECDSAKRTIEDLFNIDNRSKVHVIPEGNYINAYQDEINRSTARKRLDVDQSSFVFVYFGQIRKYKGVEKLIQTFLNSDVRAKLLIVGNPSNDIIEHYISSKSKTDERIITDLRYIPDDEVQYYLRAADVTVFPYNDILTSGSALLAMSFERPVIAPSMGCIPELLSNQDALLYQSGQTENLKQIIKHARTREDIDSIGQENMDKAQSLNWDNIAAQTIEYY